MDGWIHEQRRDHYDRDGAWAASGATLPNLHKLLFSNDFFGYPPPKSTGRNTFSLAWVKKHLLGDEAPQDVQATLLELTAHGIADAITRYCAGAQAAYVCGGGAHNGALMSRLAALSGGVYVATTRELGLDPDWVEAMAFAWLAREALAHRPANLPSVTGARGPRVLGAIYPA